MLNLDYIGKKTTTQYQPKIAVIKAEYLWRKIKY